MNNLKLLWAKSDPRHPLWKHLLDAVGVSLALPNPLALFDWQKNHTALLVGLHDIGKADSFFQHQVPEFSEKLSKAGFKPTADTKCRHERLSARFIKTKLKLAGFNTYYASAITRAVVAHHGHWDEADRPVASAYQEVQEQLWGLLCYSLDVTQLPRELPSNLSSFGMRLAGHIVLSDWIASNEKFFTDQRLQGVEDPTDYLKNVTVVAKDWIANLGFDRNQRSGKAQAIVPTPREIQRVLLENEIPPGLVIIEAPMGEGKTEAAWILSEKWRDHGYCGTYMALPTMATSDSLFLRYRDDYLRKLGYGEDTKLVHGMAWLRDANEPEKKVEIGDFGDDWINAAAWFRPTRRAMLAAHGVGTVDQAMLAGMHVKFGFLRLFGLADRVLVIDEVHAYDAYMTAIICRLLQWCACLRIPVILLSATLSSKQRAAMLEAYGASGNDPGPGAHYPLITAATPDQEVRVFETTASSTRTLKIVTHLGLLGDAQKTAAMAKDLVEKGGCCCIILNTVKQAQAVYQALNLNIEKEKLLFHSRFTAKDRLKITQRVLDLFGKDTTNRPQKFVLVATQVVEQSLDVDFDYMISEIAPVDLLLQRSGRMHRHVHRSFDPTLHVLLPEARDLEFGGTKYVYAQKPLLRTLAILATCNQASLPNDFRPLIEKCYGREEWAQPFLDWQLIRDADDDWEIESKLLAQQGKQFSLTEPNDRLFRPVNNDPVGDDSDDGNGWRAKTRLGANDHTSVLITENEVTQLESGKLWLKEVRALYQRSLKLPIYLPLECPVSGFKSAIKGKEKLRGLTLLPVGQSGAWQGTDEKGNVYEVKYDNNLGLLAGRIS